MYSDILNMHHRGYHICECQKLQKGVLCVWCIMCLQNLNPIAHLVSVRLINTFVLYEVWGVNGLGSMFLDRGSPVPLGVPPPSWPIKIILPGL